MSDFIIVSPISDDKQYGHPKRIALNVAHIVSISPTYGPRADAPDNENGSIVHHLHGTLRIQEAIGEIAGLDAPPARRESPPKAASEIEPISLPEPVVEDESIGETDRSRAKRASK